MVDDSIWPRSFARTNISAGPDPYLTDSSATKLAEFFRAKGLEAIKDEDGREQWYSDWLDYQAAHHLYASLLSPRQYSSRGNQFDLLKLARFYEMVAYFSPSHGYSLQVSFLGLFPILMGSNDALKREAVAALEAGGLMALGVSEQDHGSDLLSNEFSVTQVSAGDAKGADKFIASGRKYYIGNANCASIVSILARKYGPNDADSPQRRRRPELVLIAVRPATSPGYQNVRKIRTSGIRAAFVGSFEVKDHPLPRSDFIAEGRGAWDAVFGTVILGKFFLGFGAIGICEHAMEEAVAHLRRRILYRKTVLEMPHIRLAMAQAYARLAAMKLYAFRALDYVHAARATDRRYLLYCAIQKAKVSTEGVKVVAQLSECIGARGFESETYFESALRDIQLIPGLEGSTHINLGLTAQFIDRYFARRISDIDAIDHDGAKIRTVPQLPKSLAAGETESGENPYLMQARSGRIGDVAFAHFLDAHRPVKGVANVRRFARQVRAFARLVRHQAKRPKNVTDEEAAQHADAPAAAADIRFTLGMGQCMATVGYAQLIAENAISFAVPVPMISTVFHLLVSDLSTAAATLAALPGLDDRSRALALRLIAVPRTAESDWNFVADRARTLEGG